MSEPKCPECQTTGQFNLKPIRENHSVYVVFCTQCGHVIGTGQEYDYWALQDVRKELEQIKARLGQ